MSYDVLADLCKWLSARLGVPCSTSVPAQRPAEFVTVERTGGQTSLGRDDPNLAVQCWSGTEAGAYTLALAAREAVLSGWGGLPMVCRATVGATHHFPDPDSRAERYQIDAYLTTRP